MSVPLRIACDSVAEVVPAEELAALATPERHVVLQFASISEDEKSAPIRRLSDALPEHSVFDSGGSEGWSWVTVKKVLWGFSICLGAILGHVRIVLFGFPE